MGGEIGLTGIDIHGTKIGITSLDFHGPKVDAVIRLPDVEFMDLKLMLQYLIYVDLP